MGVDSNNQVNDNDNDKHRNSFSTNVPFLHPLKSLENPRFSDVFKGQRSGTLVQYGLMIKTIIRDRLQMSLLNIK